MAAAATGWSCRNRRFTTTKNTGTKKIASTVAESMPPPTPRPIACCPPEPAPVDSASGRATKVKPNRARGHAADAATCNRVLPARTGACRERQRQDAEDEGERGHQDRPQSQLC